MSNNNNGEADLEQLRDEVSSVVQPFTSTEVIKRLIKYLVEGAAVAVAAFLIPKTKLKQNEIVLLGLTAATILAILDTFSPMISYGARKGSGFGIGSQLVGGLGVI